MSTDDPSPPPYMGPKTSHSKCLDPEPHPPHFMYWRGDERVDCRGVYPSDG